jgi:Trm5-related predicted tRNA methylase
MVCFSQFSKVFSTFPLQERLAAATLSGPQLVVDLGFADEQNQRAHRSLLTQFAMSMNRFKLVDRPLGLHLAAFTGAIADRFNQNGAPNWRIGKHSEPVLQAFAHVPAHNIIYLSPDADEELRTLESDCVYVIGGIVDQVIKRVCHQRHLFLCS